MINVGTTARDLACRTATQGVTRLWHKQSRSKRIGFPLCCALALLSGTTGYAQDGKHLVEHFQCGRCHEVPASIARVPGLLNCLRCHQAILSGKGDSFSSPEEVARWKTRLKSVVQTPSLTALNGRLSPKWANKFLTNPYHVRVRMPASMPRMPISAAQAEAITSFLYSSNTPEVAAQPAPGNPQAGMKTLRFRGCFGCHLFTGAAVPLHPAGTTAFQPRQLMAPDLRYTRERMSPALLARWLAGPSRVSHDTLMIPAVLDPNEVSDVISAIVDTPLAPLPRFEEPRLAPLSRYVPFKEVQAKVLNSVCRHCHANPAVVGPEAGAGATGGFGYAGVELDLTSESGLKRGLRRAGATQRESVLAEHSSGYPRLVEVMLARHGEDHQLSNIGMLGMPLGLAPIPYEDIRLVITWTRQDSSP